MGGAGRVVVVVGSPIGFSAVFENVLQNGYYAAMASAVAACSGCVLCGGDLPRWAGDLQRVFYGSSWDVPYSGGAYTGRCPTAVGQ